MSDKKCIDCKFKLENPCKPCYENVSLLGWHYYWEPITEEATPYANGLIKEFLVDFEEVVRYFKLDGHLIGTIRRKWEKRLKS